MSIACMLFVEKEIPAQLDIRVGIINKRIPEDPLELGHWDMWDRCFSAGPRLLPRYHYGFVFGQFNLNALDQERNEQKRHQKYAEYSRLFIIRLIKEYGVEPLYIRLHADYVLSDGDVENAEEMDLAHTVFKGKDSPEELKFEMNRFYRFTCK